MSAPTPDQVVPRSGAPRFFRHVWNPPGAGTTRTVGNTAIITPEVPEGGLVIYGYAAQSTYAEDRRIEDQAWERGRSFGAFCFSEVEQHGEWGFVPLDETQEISREEFDAARERGFR